MREIQYMIINEQASGTILPFYDPDTHILFLAGKGDGNIRYYEVIADS